MALVETTDHKTPLHSRIFDNNSEEDQNSALLCFARNIK